MFDCLEFIIRLKKKTLITELSINAHSLLDQCHSNQKIEERVCR